jgi:hypothetical protein
MVTAPGSKPGATALRAVPGALRVRLPPLPLDWLFTVRRAPGRAVRRQSSKLDRWVQLPRGTLGNRLTGRLPDFESGGGGSNPPSRTPDPHTPGQLRLVVTPRSERGGRWFDSSPRNSRREKHDEADGSHPAGSGAWLETRWRPGAACGFESHGFRILSSMKPGSVGNRQTTLVQTERC